MKFFSLLFLLATVLPLHAVPVISEFLADNDGGLKDEDGDDSDWIEIYNPDATPVDMAGWRLTDDITRPSKWVFPSVIIPGNGWLVVWASEKDRDVGQLHTNFQLDQDGEYLALISPAGTATSQWNPFPFQSKNYSFGSGIGGNVTVTDGTPAVLTAGTHYSRIKLSGIGTAVQDGKSLNNFDDTMNLPEHQQYLWFDYGSRLSAVPVGHQIAEATLEWGAESKLFAGVSNLGTVQTPVGVFIQPNDGNRGITAIGTGADGRDLIDFYAATTPYAAITIQQGEQRGFTWNVTQLVKDWLANPGAGNFGKFILVTGAQPCWIAWDQNRPGPKLTIRSVAGTPVIVQGFMAAPSPGSVNGSVTAAGPLVRELTENPPPPAAGTDLLITARVAPFQGGAVGGVSLRYRRAYDAEVILAMNDAGTAGDVAAGDGVWSALIPSAVVQAGQMLRWRVLATDAAGYSFTMPPFRDGSLAFNLQDSPQYFGTVPNNPAVVTPFQVIHRFIQSPTSANNTTGTSCAIFMNGEFYDNCRINIHGQSTSGVAFLKKSYDIDGNRGYRFKWSTDPLQLRAKDFNLMTIYADKTKLRHVLAYEMNREAGVAAHLAFTTHNRLNGTFDGIYDFIEDGDDVYLERAGLNKEGVLYKCYTNMADPATGANTASGNANGVEKKTRKHENNFDLYQFLQGMHLTDANARKAFLFDNLDVPKMINMMAANTVTGNVDLHAKNYYIYRDTGRTNLWTLLPWDLDLSQGRLWTSANNYFDDGMYINPGGTLSGQGQNLVAKLYALPEFSNMARRRIRSLHEKFWRGTAATPNPRDTTRWYSRRVNEMAGLFGASWTVGQTDTPGMDAALDYGRYTAAAWRNHTGVTGNTAASIYAAYNMSQELQRLADTYIVQRWNVIHSDGSVPAAYTIASLQPLTFSAVEHSPASGDQDQEYIAITNPNSVSVDLSGWQITGGVTFTFEPGTVVNGTATAGANANRIYIAASRNGFKTRTVSPKGGESLNVVGGYQGHLSNLGETLSLFDDTGALRATTTYTGTPSPQQEHLVVTEVMYNPGGNGLAEFIEVMNISSSVTVDMTSVRFNAGVEFDFTGSAVTSLAPGARALVVRNLAAFTAVHGNSHPVAGVFANDTALNNAGETIKLEDPLNNTISDFTYDDVAPWPAADGNGASLVLKRPEAKPDPAIPGNWRASIATGGNPGGDDVLRFAGNPSEDADKDGLPRFMEYLFGTSDSAPNSLDLNPVRGTTAGGVPFLDITVIRVPNADDVSIEPQYSTDLNTWNTQDLTLFSTSPGANDTVIETWRLTGEAAEEDRVMIRCRCTHL
jgi:hypothetical protein